MCGCSDGVQMMEQGNVAFAMEPDSDDEDAEDDAILPTDALFVCAMTEDEYSHLEVHLVSEDGNMFVHHDITLPDFPLCLAWTDCPPFLTEGGSQMAVGKHYRHSICTPTMCTAVGRRIS
jgi:hypothetical protein